MLLSSLIDFTLYFKLEMHQIVLELVYVPNLILIITNLKSIGKSKEWLEQQLKVKGYNNFTNILLLTIDNYDNIKIYESSKTANDRDTLE